MSTETEEMLDRTIAGICDHWGGVVAKRFMALAERYTQQCQEAMAQWKQSYDKQARRMLDVALRAKAGQTYEEIAEHYGITRQRVEQLLRQVSGRERRSPLSVAECAEIVAGYEDGARVAELAEKHGVSRIAVRQVLHDSHIATPCPRSGMQDAIVAHLMQAKMCLADIARECDTTPQVVITTRNRLKAHGIEVPKLPRSTYKEPQPLVKHKCERCGTVRDVKPYKVPKSGLCPTCWSNRKGKPS